MKWIFGVFSLSFLFLACDNELIVTDEWKDIPVVWGLVSKSDTAHYIRVEKAFLDPTTSALDIARLPDSLYYEGAEVSLKRIASGQVFPLTLVDGDHEGYPRDSGTFAESPNYLFKIKASAINLVVGEKYQFILQRPGELAPVTAETIILPKPVIRKPQVGSDLAFKSNVIFVFNWNEIEDAGLYDLQMKFHYKERSPETGNMYVPKSVGWTIAQSIQDVEYRMDGAEFYNSVNANIEEDANATRIFDSVDVVILCGGLELEAFLKVTNANTGITSTQDVPRYTNLSEGIGIFTSRNFSNNTGYGLVNQTLDSLKHGSITGHLNFQ